MQISSYNNISRAEHCILQQNDMRHVTLLLGMIKKLIVIFNSKMIENASIAEFCIF